MEESEYEATRVFTPQRLSWVANVLFVVFAISVLDTAYPLQLLNPNWQISLTNSLLNFAIFPLIGLGLLHLAADLSPADDPLQRRRRLFSRFAAWASIGFLLLTILQPVRLWHQLRLVEQGQLRPLRRSEQIVDQVRWVLRSSRSSAEIQMKLKALQAPPTPEQYASLPIAELREKIREDLVLAEQQLRKLRTQTQTTIQEGRQTFLRMLIRNSILSLAFMLGFSAVGQRRRSLIPLLQEWMLGLDGMIHRILPQSEADQDGFAEDDLNDVDAFIANHPDAFDSEEQLQAGPGTLPPMPSRRLTRGSLDKEMASFIEEIAPSEHDAANAKQDEGT